MDIDTGFEEVITNSENAISVGAITLGFMGLLFLAILIFDIVTFPRQFQFLKVRQQLLLYHYLTTKKLAELYSAA